MVAVLFDLVVFVTGVLIGVSLQRILWRWRNQRILARVTPSAVTLPGENGNGRQRFTTVVHSFAEPGKKGFAKPNQIERTK